MRQRHGFTLVEILVSLVTLSIVAGAVYKLLDTSQRLSQAQAERVSLQSNVRTGSLAVPAELRELNTAFGAGMDRNDILLAQPDLIRYRAMRGLGFLCQAAVAPVTQLRLASATWSGFRTPAINRDSLLLFVDDDPNDDADDAWMVVGITAVAPSANACGAGVAGITLTVAPVAPVAAVPPVPLHTPVRLFEVMELNLEEDDGAWWLGARSVSANEVAPQPVLGPLTDDGFQLVYLDSTGVATANVTAIKSVRLTVRGLTDGQVRVGTSGTLGHPEEELVTQVVLRNSIRP